MTAADHGTLIDLQMMWNRLVAVVEEQAQVLQRTAFSPIVREAGDLSAGVFDTQGQMLAQAVTGTPGHVNSMALTVGHVLRHFPAETMKPGDAFITNDPWMGTGHTNDFVVTTPCFHRGRLVGLFSCTSHLVDIGGLGTPTDATDVFMEGLYIPMLKILDQGQVNETLMAMIRANSRMPVDSEGDTYSLINCNAVGCQRLTEMMAEFGLEDLDTLAEHIITHSRDAVLAEIAKLPRGTWHNTMVTDGYDHPITLRAALTIGAEGIHVDFAGSDSIVPRGINVPFCYTLAYTVFGLGCIVAKHIPNNHGSLAPLTISAPENSIVNALKPAAVSARHIIGQIMPDLVFGCLRQALPDRVPAEGAATMWNVILSGPRHSPPRFGASFRVTMTGSGGMGALPQHDGLSATSYPSGVRGTSVEIIEAIAPVIVWQKEYAIGSAGEGRQRGGLGQAIQVGSSIGEGFRFHAAHERIVYPPRGVAGGLDGAPGYLGLASGSRLHGKGLQAIPADDRLVVRTPGGGGLGDPGDREQHLREADQRAGLMPQPGLREEEGEA
jgi:N-methylhydantoinase B